VRFRNLRQRNIGIDLAAETAGSAHGQWRLAKSPALSMAFPIPYFHAFGLPRLVDALAQPN
jgi:RNA-directed DNA polymerase